MTLTDLARKHGTDYDIVLPEKKLRPLTNRHLAAITAGAIAAQAETTLLLANRDKRIVELEAVVTLMDRLLALKGVLPAEEFRACYAAIRGCRCSKD